MCAFFIKKKMYKKKKIQTAVEQFCFDDAAYALDQLYTILHGVVFSLC